MPPKRVSARRSSLPPLPAPLLAPVASAIQLPHPSGAWRWLAFISAFFLPALGVGFAFLYWKAQDETVRRFSRIALVLAVLGALLSAGGDAFEAGMQSGEWFIQPY